MKIILMQNIINAVTYCCVIVILSLFKVEREMQQQIKTFYSLNTSIGVANSKHDESQDIYCTANKLFQLIQIN